MSTSLWNKRPAKCHCCLEDDKLHAGFDTILGLICEDCLKGSRLAVRGLDKAGIGSVFTGACGDNKSGGQLV